MLSLKLSLVIRCSLFLKGADVVSYLTITTVSHNVRFASFSVENVLAVDSRPTVSTDIVGEGVVVRAVRRRRGGCSASGFTESSVACTPSFTLYDDGRISWANEPPAGTGEELERGKERYSTYRADYRILNSFVITPLGNFGEDRVCCGYLLERTHLPTTPHS